MWVDGVGGFLLLPGDDWTIGGPSGSDEAEICIQGDLTRREACIRRHGNDYVLQPLGTVFLGGRRMNRPTTLRDADQITLGKAGQQGLAGGTGRGVQIEFTKPHPLSSSAKLILDGRHRSRPRSDAIILLADTCILGPTRASHVSTPLAESEVALLYRDGKWICRGAGETLVDGQSHSGRVAVPAGAKIECCGLSFTLEEARA
jgi:hypothetical protein